MIFVLLRGLITDLLPIEIFQAFNMSVEKEKSKVHKLSLKGMLPVVKYGDSSLTTVRIFKIGGRICKTQKND